MKNSVCMGKTSRGTNCKKVVKNGEYCAYHMPKEEVEVCDVVALPKMQPPVIESDSESESDSDASGIDEEYFLNSLASMTLEFANNIGVECAEKEAGQNAFKDLFKTIAPSMFDFVQQHIIVPETLEQKQTSHCQIEEIKTDIEKVD